MISEVIAGGIIGIVGIFIGTILGYLLNLRLEKSKEKKEYCILKRKINRQLNKIKMFLDLMISCLNEQPEIKNKSNLAELKASLKISEFFQLIYEFEKLLDQLVYYKDETESFDNAIRDLKLYTRGFESLLMVEETFQGSIYPLDLKPDLNEIVEYIKKSLELIQTEFEKIK